MRNAVFRTDASVQIGTGHVMRCLTLADALRRKGIDSTFICRDHPGHLATVIKERGYAVNMLPAHSGWQENAAPGHLAHSAWLGSTQSMDSAACRPLLESLRPYWLIVDHYALDECWEMSLRDCYTRLLVIDDLADRRHQCEVLLDQNLGHTEADYLYLTPTQCRRLIGPQYALLRPEFSATRDYSVLRRRSASLKYWLITMGGVDSKNITGKILDALAGIQLPKEGRITVIMGAKAPHLAVVQRQAAKIGVPAEVLCGVNDMARHMAENDLCIGAAGGTAWERCCLGVPTLLVVLAENQVSGANAIVRAGAAEFLALDRIGLDLPQWIRVFQEDPERLERMSQAGLAMTAGTGAEDVATFLVSGEYANGR
ncbi:UDP-2,4-diacetamido-2,4,6-trideoxy-beta-L-altropyranose hydrolase [Castellaniella denitrificans]|uniref:UDP-2,4-diacetamido-2,4, 6-trideoxy-beta-L-altropyranose hydrolase n=1 Tax=Castellaniella denitrificans TaxID=56119 RepID=A0ABT4LZU2_9BURK|nr:UDP-2,4-diacetamido-2,4,6-trideoxy-beta-L-altropyranose hydrolase [Castellaniella denitrificans]MCZ4328561.1 UDP-2,4-diacetamido-2,4,6-trideoxy-beta-L-altropyranose hydrolase [Castellaniella denitrificans]